MALGAINRDTDTGILADTVNRLVTEFNRQDTRTPIFAADTGSATAYAIAPIPGITQYRLGEIFEFRAVNANTGTAPTLNVNGKGAGVITKFGGAALAIGDIAAGASIMVQVTGISPVTFQLLSPAAFAVAGATTFLGVNVVLNNIANFFDGPNTGSIGANGQTWEISAVAFMADTGAAAILEAAIFNGSVYIADVTGTITGANLGLTLTFGAIVVLTGPTTFTLRAKDQTNITGVLLTTGNTTGIASRATSITAKRLA